MSDIWGKLSAKETGLFYKLMIFCSGYDNVLRIGGKKDGRVVTIDDLVTFYKLTPKTVKKHLKKFEELKLVGFHERDDYYPEDFITANPFIFRRHEELMRWVYDYYADTEWNDPDVETILIGNYRVNDTGELVDYNNDY